jgi:hypothetical protein
MTTSAQPKKKAPKRNGSAEILFEKFQDVKYNLCKQDIFFSATMSTDMLCII